MIHRLELVSKVLDSRSAVRRAKFLELSLDGKIKDVTIVDVYTIDRDFTKQELKQIASLLTNPITHEALLDKPAHPPFSYVIEVGFLPGVTDNIATTATETIQDALKLEKSSVPFVYTSQMTFIDGNVSEEDIQKLASSLYNPLIQRVEIKNCAQYEKDHGMSKVAPKVQLEVQQNSGVGQVNLDVPDEELVKIGTQGIENTDGTRRGPLALELAYMKTIQAYFKKKKRKPTDIELESIAQTWSEHCKHTIFADPLDEITSGLYKTYIKAATTEVRKQKGKEDFCESVFTDNSGEITFDEIYSVTHKVETHNSPSALDPFGGAITGIVGVNRDAIGFGLGAKPIVNTYGFCLAHPDDSTVLYRDKNRTQNLLSPRRIMDGVIQGVNVGGNCSGIPSPQGFLYFDPRYRGKPLVFAGTVGLIPKTVNKKSSDHKQAMPGDYIVMVGGRVGKDGIHGATFSSVALDSGSPATAVQIGDPITQKKLSDAIIKEARDQELYTSITDDGAGGLSCSVAEMAKESQGCKVELEKVPLKYPGLSPWEIWISESQERMTLSVPPEKWDIFKALMESRGVEATVIGEFTDSGKCEVFYNGEKIVDIELDFLHDGLPQKELTTKPRENTELDPHIDPPDDYTDTYLDMVGRLNVASYEFLSRQYDHTVQGSCVLGPLQGKGRVNSDASVMRPVLSSHK
ncbi:phosphoribosylformylglycinamidine synthase, partial [Candidatus Roizmanbacteria bacterium]|nr:phosphoribosylformylglycinamidine synthase [Candidatus Roizmanbacteria bacterium]